QAAGRARRSLPGGAGMVNRRPGEAVARGARRLSLPTLDTVAPRRREPTPEGSAGSWRKTPRPVYEPAPIASRPYADQIAEWLDVLETTPLLELGARADAVRRERHPEGIVTYIVDRNINYTNLCVTDCRFCAFYRRPKDAEAYVLSYEEIGRKIDEAKELGAVQILIQGGHNPYLPLDWYLELLRYIKEPHPIHVHGFSASEIDLIARVSKRPFHEVLRELHEAGLDSMPGAGAEILVDAVRDFIAPKKIDASYWFEIHEAAHEIGLHTTATMMYGVGESWADRIEHLVKLRASQQRSLARGKGRY